MPLTIEDKKWLVKLAKVTVISLAKVMQWKCSMRMIHNDFCVMFALPSDEPRISRGKDYDGIPF